MFDKKLQSHRGFEKSRRVLEHQSAITLPVIYFVTSLRCALSLLSVSFNMFAAGA